MLWVKQYKGVMQECKVSASREWTATSSRVVSVPKGGGQEWLRTRRRLSQQETTKANSW